MLADLLRTDRHNHRPIAVDSPEADAVKVLARGHQNLVWMRNRHTNHLPPAELEVPHYRQIAALTEAG